MTEHPAVSSTIPLLFHNFHDADMRYNEMHPIILGVRSKYMEKKTDRENDVRFMQRALEEAEKAFQKGEVPIGAVLVKEGMVLACAHNLREWLKDPSAHAEIVVLREGTVQSDSWRIEGSTLYVTKEPCIMCAGALINARIKRLVYGCPDAKAGGVDSLYHILSDERLNHQVEVTSGVLEEECAEVLKRFFKERR